MKLAFVIGSLHIGGAERVITEITGGLAERGHDVTLIYNFKNRDYEVNDKVKQIDLGGFEHDIRHGRKLLRIKNKIVNIFHDYKFLKNYIKNEDPDCFISFMQCWAWYLGGIFRKDIHVIFSEHSSMLLKSGSIGRWIKKHFLLPRADAVTVLTKFDLGIVYKLMPNARCLPNPLTFEQINEDEYETLFPNRRNLLACGRLDPVKGYDNLIKAFYQIADKYPNWNLDIAGKDMPDKNYSQTLKSLIIDLRLESRVNLIGFHSDVKDLMRKYAIFCVPSRSEGFSLTLIEAMACGVATIAYELTGPREITLNKVDGLLVENQNIEALAEGMEYLIKNDKIRYEYGKRALMNVERFKEDAIVSMWEKLIENCVKNNEK
jgi:glycosyltransferase involved in cell wall biosynthesis